MTDRSLASVSERVFGLARIAVLLTEPGELDLRIGVRRLAPGPLLKRRHRLAAPVLFDEQHGQCPLADPNNTRALVALGQLREATVPVVGPDPLRGATFAATVGCRPSTASARE